MAKIFLSHNSKDKPFVRILADRLRAQRHDVWLDEIELSIGDSLFEKISKGLEEADFVLAFISKNSVTSHWVQKELNLAMHKEIEGKTVVVLPLLIDHCDIPFFLRDKFYADFRNPKNFESEIKKIETSLLFHGITKTGKSVTKSKDTLINDVSVGKPLMGSYIFNKDSEDWLFHKRLQSDKRYTTLTMFACVIAFLLSLLSEKYLPELSRRLLAFSIVLLSLASLLFFSYAFGMFTLEHDKPVVFGIEERGYFSMPFGKKFWSLMMEGNIIFKLHLVTNAIYIVTAYLAIVWAFFAIVL